MLWDVFCRVIDNHGDLGVCWRLSADLAARGQRVRLWVDDGSALHWMAPGALEGHWPGVQVMPWAQSGDAETLSALPPAAVWIEAFGCDIPPAFVAHHATQIRQASDEADAGQAGASTAPAWINLEYLSAEAYVERSHRLPSPVMRGPARGWTKTFFYPGFSTKTGGLLREPGLAAHTAHAPDAAARSTFFAALGVPWQGETLLTLFCYEPPLLQALLDHLATAPTPTRLLVTAGRAAGAARALLGGHSSLGPLQISYLPYLTQRDFDRLLASADVNFVRGEDSVVRALWAGKPFVWQIYPQEDGAQAAKLDAFLDSMAFSPAVCQLHRAWNGLPIAGQVAAALEPLQAPALPMWQAEVQAARARLLKMDDLCSGLLQFVRNKR